MSEPAGTTPPGRSQAPTKKSRLLFWLGCTGCLFMLLLVGVGGTMMWMFIGDRGKNHVEPLAADWQVKFRAAYTPPPELAMLLPAQGPIEADPSATMPVLDTTHRGRQSLAQRLARGLAMQPGDKAILDGTLRDTALDRVAALARMSGYDVMHRLRTTRPEQLIGPRADLLSPQNFRVARNAMDLTLRGEARLRARDLRGARSDFTAATAIGAALWRTEMSLWDLRNARGLIGAGAQGLVRLGAAARDTALARRASVVTAWVDSSRSAWFQLWEFPDSMLIIAADTGLPRGIRAQAIADLTAASIVTPSRIISGPQESVMEGVRSLRSDRDSALAFVAGIADSTLRAYDRMWPLGRFRYLSRGPRR